MRTAVDGKEALEEIQKDAPDILISDLIMPEVAGEQAVEYVRATPQPGSFSAGTRLEGNHRDPERLRPSVGRKDTDEHQGERYTNPGGIAAGR